MTSLGASDAAVVATEQGPVRGVEMEGLRVWRGLPYAQPPAGPLRFRAPQPPSPREGIRAASELGPVAWQSEVINPLTGELRALERSEDCLYLNVTAPAAPPPGPAGYPVLVWIHGGGYVQGFGADEIVGDGAALARRGLVVVTFNYRLGALGFADLGEAYPESGEAGFLDQVAALRWVQANIAGFGGDPARITVYGVSAGAKSVANLMASPLTTGLISRAISASGGGEHVASYDQAARVRRRLLREVGLSEDEVGRLWDVPPEDFVAAQESIAPGAQGTWVWRPVVGGAGIPVLPADAIAAGAAAGIPLLVGNTGTEGATYQLMDPAPGGQAPRVLAELFGDQDASAMLAQYATARPELDADGINIAVFGAERYGVPTYRLARGQAGHAPVWRYRYDGCPPGMPGQLTGGHGLDMAAVWGADGFARQAEGGDAQAGLCLAMADAWAAFARGEPPADGSGPLPEWERFEAENEWTMILDAKPRLERHPRRAELEIWRGRTWRSGTWWSLDGL